MNVRHILAKASPEHQHVRAYAFESKDPPVTIQLWNVGDNPTDYGVHKWTDRSQVEVLALYNERGNPLLIDVEHNGVDVDGEPTRTGGYARLELRDGAPWLTFDWSSYAIEQIASRQRLFLSPEYDVDADTNEITKLYRVSLVADPGTHRARVLASADSNTKEASDMDPVLAAILAILEGVSDPAEAIASIKNAIASLSGGDAPAADPAANPASAAPAYTASDDAPDKKEPVAAAAKGKPEAAKADVKAEPKPGDSPVVVAASAPAVTPAESEAIKASRANAIRSENALRDLLLEKHGDRLAPSIRTWASAQPLAVVEGLIKAAPEAKAPPARVTATRGAGHGTNGTPATGLAGKDLEELQRGMGTFRANTPREPYTDANGNFVLPTNTPTEHRKIMAARAAKDGK